MKGKLMAVISIFAIAAISCNEEKKEDLVQSVNKNGSIESAVKVNRLQDGNDELVTTHKVWVKGDIYKTVEYRDTLPGLGLQHTTAENAEGETASVEVPKEYEIYITVK